MNLLQALQLPSLQDAKVVAGAEGLQKTIRWVSIVDLPDPLSCVSSGDLLLTTGFGLPKKEEQLTELIGEMSKCGLAGLGLAVPEYFTHMPFSVCKAADELRFPIIEIPWEVQFNTVTEEVLSSILAYQYNLQERSEYIHQKLIEIALNAKDLQDIASILGKLIERSVIVQHPEGPILTAYYANPSRSQENQGSNQDLFFFRKEQLEHIPLHSLSKPIQYPAMPDSGLPARLLCPISVDKQLVSLLWIIDDQQSLRNMDLQAIQSASLIMALHISQQRALTSLEFQLGYSFLDSLLESLSHPTPQILHRAGILGYDSEGKYAVGIIVINIPTPLSRESILKRERLAERLKRCMQVLQIPPVFSLMQNQIVFLIPERISAAEIWHSMKDVNISLAVSLLHTFKNARHAYKEVRSLLPYVRYGQFHSYEDLFIPRILMGEIEAHSGFLDKLFGPLRDHKSGDILIHTLLTFASMGFHIQKTSETLKIHPKTLRYRLDRAIALGGYQLDNPETQFHFQLAHHILQAQ
ncbi:PucR family transcriptional regulator [Cohnella pontilimi]|nr:PucR family transcriptional regulator [Cohnella pontilimi]